MHWLPLAWKSTPVPLRWIVILCSEAIKESLLVVEMENCIRISFLLFWGDGETQQRQTFCGNFVLQANKKWTKIQRRLVTIWGLFLKTNKDTTPLWHGCKSSSVNLLLDLWLLPNQEQCVCTACVYLVLVPNSNATSENPVLCDHPYDHEDQISCYFNHFDVMVQEVN